MNALLADLAESAPIDILRFRLAPNVSARADGDRLAFDSPHHALAFDGLGAASYAALARLNAAETSPEMDEAAILASDGVLGLAAYHAALAALANRGLLRIDVGPGLATLVPISPQFRWSWSAVSGVTAVRLSRFAFVHREADGRVVLESPRAHARMELHAPAALGALVHLARSTSAHALERDVHDLDAASAAAFVSLLVTAGFADAPGAEGAGEDDDPVLRQWEFHDLLFHTRSRIGRHDRAIGGNYRFVGVLPPRPAVKTLGGLPFVELPKPDLTELAASDPSLLHVMETRVSIRDDARLPVTLEQLATFLYRVARVKSTTPMGRLGVLTHRPYPNGGASYELELYLTIERCDGVAPGFYWYDPVGHHLVLVRLPDTDTRRVTDLAQAAMAGMSRPQIVLTLAARFQRVAWKYDGIAYATILRNAGVLYATMYYVATAMGLAPCGLGTGDADHFAKLAGTSYYEESSVGEFALGGSAPPA